MKLSTYMRRVIRRNPFLYRPYLQVFGPKLERTFPVDGVDLHLTGYPRCANTFAFRLAHQVFPSLNLSTHLHVVASLKMALGRSIPTIVLIREPLQAVASLVLKGYRPGDDSDTLSLYLDDYIEYYSFVANCPGLKVFDFDTLIEESIELCKLISRTVGVSFEEEQFEQAHREVVEAMKTAEQAREDSVSQLPNEKKAAMKKQYLERVKSHPKFDAALKLYTVLTDNSI